MENAGGVDLSAFGTGPQVWKMREWKYPEKKCTGYGKPFVIMSCRVIDIARRLGLNMETFYLHAQSLQRELGTSLGEAYKRKGV